MPGISSGLKGTGAKLGEADKEAVVGGLDCSRFKICAPWCGPPQGGALEGGGCWRWSEGEGVPEGGDCNPPQPAAEDGGGCWRWRAYGLLGWPGDGEGCRGYGLWRWLVGLPGAGKPWAVEGPINTCAEGLVGGGGMALLCVVKAWERAARTASSNTGSDQAARSATLLAKSVSS